MFVVIQYSAGFSQDVVVLEKQVIQGTIDVYIVGVLYVDHLVDQTLNTCASHNLVRQSAVYIVYKHIGYL